MSDNRLRRHIAVEAARLMYERVENVQGTLGAKLRARLAAHEWFDDLLALRGIDDRARRPGAVVCTVDEAVAFLREMEEVLGTEY